jgi:GT2 family glycosyltransferase
MSRVVVIVLNWNGAAVVGDCLHGLRQQSFCDFHTLVVDNNSKDHSRRLIEEEFPDVEVLPLPDNYGFARGNNEGIKYIWKTRPSIQYIALLNNDTCPQPHWLGALVTALDERSDMGMIASKMLCWDGANQPIAIDTAGDVFYQHGLAGKRGHGAPVDAYDAAEEVFGACAGAALYRNDMLKEIGLLDEAFFAYNEDVDWDFRARLAGWRCWYVPDAIVWHRVSFTAQPYSDRAIYWSKRNSFWVLVKNWPASFFLKYCLPLVGYNVLSDLRWMLAGRIAPVVKARWDGLRGLRAMLKQRKHIQFIREITPQDLDRWIVRKTPWCETFRRNLKRMIGGK